MSGNEMMMLPNGARAVVSTRRGEHMPLGEHAHRAACTGLPHANHARDGSTEQNRNNQQGHDFRTKPCNLEGACASVWDPRNEATFGREREQVSGVEGMRRNLRKGQRERGAVVSCDLGVWGRTRPAPGVAASLIETRHLCAHAGVAVGVGYKVNASTVARSLAIRRVRRYTIISVPCPLGEIDLTCDN